MSTDTLIRPARTSTVLRTGALAGLAWFVAGFGATTPDSPEVGAPAADIRAYAEAGESTLGVNALSSVAGVVALLVLVSVLARLIRAHRPDSVVPGFVTGAGALAAVQMMLFSGVYAVWLMVDPAELSDGAVESLFTAGLVADLFGSLVLVVTCAMVGAVSWTGLRDGFLSRPVAVLGLLILAAELVSLLRLVSSASAFEAAMYAGIFGWFLWPAIVGVDLGIRHLRERRQA
jgi:hypothetical protein